MPTRPVWAEISLERLTANYRLLRALATASAPGAELLAVVKANAYGHGVEACGPALAAAGAAWLGVTSVEEGAALRRALGVLPSPLSATRILVMSSLWHGEADAVLARALTPQVWEPYQIALLDEAAKRHGVANFPVHLEIDTGMSRQGVAPGARLAALLDRHAGSALTLEGVLTHFSAPERLDLPATEAQMDGLSRALDQLAAADLHPRWIHAGNSATVFRAEQIAGLVKLAAQHRAQLMLRPGLALYGYPVRFVPSAAPLAIEASSQENLRPVLAWKTRVTSLRDLVPGEAAGYNSTFRAARPTRLALVPAGYADGLNRLLSNRGALLLRGKRALIAGRISMDQTMLDVTAIEGAAIGDEVAILGTQGNEVITAWEHADLCATIPYEVLCSVAARVSRTVID